MGIRGGWVCGAASLGSPLNCWRVPLRRSAAPEKTLWVRRALDATLSPIGGAAAPCFVFAEEETDWTSDTAPGPTPTAESVPPTVSVGGGFSGFDAGEVSGPNIEPVLRVGTETECATKPPAGRSPSNPEPVKVSPPTEASTDRCGEDSGADVLPVVDDPLLER